MRRELGVLSVCLLVAFSAAAFGADTMPAEQTKKGVIKSVDAKAKSFVMMVARELMFTGTEKTKYTLDGKESTFDEAVKVDRKASVTYSIDTTLPKDKGRMASKVEVTTGDAK